MGPESVPAELLEVREKIDQTDQQIIALLAQRFQLTHRVGELKAIHALDALDPGREAEKLAEIEAICQQNGLNPVLVTALFDQIMEEVKRNHKRLREQHSS